LRQAQNLSGQFEGDGDVIELVDLISKAKQLLVKPPAKAVEKEPSE
jgi:hypothetical protein